MTRLNDTEWKKQVKHLESLESHLEEINKSLKQSKVEFDNSPMHLDEGHEWEDIKPSLEEKKTTIVRAIVKQLNTMKEVCEQWLKEDDNPAYKDAIAKITTKLSHVQSSDSTRLELTADEVLKQNLDQNLKNFIADLEALEASGVEDEAVLATMRNIAYHLREPITPTQALKAQAFEKELSQKSEALHPGSKLSALYHKLLDLLIDFKVLIKAIKPENASEEKVKHRQAEITKINKIVNLSNKQPQQKLLETKTRLKSEIYILENKPVLADQRKKDTSLENVASPNLRTLTR